MKISKMISIVNESIYLFIALALLGFYLNSNNLLIIGIIIIYLAFLLKKSLHTFIIIIIFMFLFVYNYHHQYIDIFNINESSKITCIIDTIPQYKEKHIQFYCKNHHNRFLVYLINTEEVLKIGDEIVMENHLEKIKNNTVPNQFNYAKYLLSYRIGYQNKIEKIKIVENNKKIHYKWINNIINYYHDSPVSEYLLSFIIGDKKALDDSFTEKIQVLNVSHLFVVSGFHVGFLYFLFKYIFKYFKITNEKSDFITSILLLVFLILNNFSISVLRAFCLIIGVLIKKYIKLPLENIQILSLIGCVNLLINPFALNNMGFILSYMITFILFLSQTVINGNSKFLIKFYKINIVAQMFSLPIVANFNFSYNFISLIITPLISFFYAFIIFPVTLLCLVIKPFAYNFQFLFIFFENLLNLLSSISILSINIGCFDTLRTILYYFFLFILMKKIENKHFSYINLVILIVVMLYYHKLSLTDEVTFIDVGQGDSIFIKSHLDHCSALIDTGGNLYYHPGENVSNYLKSIQVRQIDILFITHSDLDHALDYELILNEFEIKNIVFSLYDQSELKEKIEEDAKFKNINILKLKAYNKVECGNLTFHILNPQQKNNTINDNSLVLFLIFNKENYLFMADSSSDIYLEERSIDFLKVSHHGSKYQTSKEFLNSLYVKNAVISVGKNNYKHPSDELLILLDEYNIYYFRTDIDGSISVKYYLKKKRMIIIHQPYNIDT